MVAASDAGPAVPQRRETPRIVLARAAADAAASCAGVARLDRGPQDRYCTYAGDDVLPGVVVIADAEPGTYAVAIALQARMTDLRVLAGEVREAVLAAAADAGLAAAVGEVRVAITDIDDGSPE